MASSSTSSKSQLATPYIETMLACGHITLSTRLYSIYSDDAAPEVPKFLSIIGFAQQHIALPIISMYWMTLGPILNDEHENDIFQMLWMSLHDQDLAGVVTLGNDWYGIIAPPKSDKQKESTEAYFHFSIFPQGLEKHIFDDPSKLRNIQPKSYASDTKIPLPKPELVESLLHKLQKYGQHLPHDESKFKPVISQCQRMIDVFHHTLLRGEILQILHSLRQKNTNGDATRILTETLRQLGDYEFDLEMEDEEATGGYHEETSDFIEQPQYGMSLTNLLN